VLVIVSDDVCCVCVGVLSQRAGDDQSKLLTMNQYYNAAAAAAAAAANPSISPASAMSLIQAAMTPPPALQGKHCTCSCLTASALTGNCFVCESCRENLTPGSCDCQRCKLEAYLFNYNTGCLTLLEISWKFAKSPGNFSG